MFHFFGRLNRNVFEYRSLEEDITPVGVNTASQNVVTAPSSVEKQGGCDNTEPTALQLFENERKERALYIEQNISLTDLKSEIKREVDALRIFLRHDSREFPVAYYVGRVAIAISRAIHSTKEDPLMHFAWLDGELQDVTYIVSALGVDAQYISGIYDLGYYFSYDECLYFAYHQDIDPLEFVSQNTPEQNKKMTAEFVKLEGMKKVSYMRDFVREKVDNLKTQLKKLPPDIAAETSASLGEIYTKFIKEKDEYRPKLAAQIEADKKKAEKKKLQSDIESIMLVLANKELEKNTNWSDLKCVTDKLALLDKAEIELALREIKSELPVFILRNPQDKPLCDRVNAQLENWALMNLSANAVPKAAPPVVPETAPPVVPKAAPLSVPKAAPPVVPKAAPPVVPKAAPLAVPQPVDVEIITQQLAQVNINQPAIPGSEAKRNDQRNPESIKKKLHFNGEADNVQADLVEAALRSSPEITNAKALHKNNMAQAKGNDEDLSEKPQHNFITNSFV